MSKEKGIERMEEEEEGEGENGDVGSWRVSEGNLDKEEQKR